MISRVTAFIENETIQIRDDQGFDFRSSSEKKSRFLLELNRMSRTLDPANLDHQILTELSCLKTALRANDSRIRAHLRAVREVSKLMVDILQNEDADGTYGEFL